MNKMVSIILSLYIFSGCDAFEFYKQEASTKVKSNNARSVIFDDDSLSDNDIAQTLSAAMTLQAKGLVDIRVIGISGVDTNNKRSLLLSSITHYYGYSEIPIVASYRSDTRVQESIYSHYPPLSSSYRGTSSDLSEFENDGILDSQRDEVITKYCEVLESIPEGEKIAIAVMGNSYNIESLLKEQDICNGYQLVKERVSKVVMVGGTDNSNWDMNFGAFGKYHRAAVSSSSYVVKNTPVPVVLIDVNAGCGYPGQAYQELSKADVESPMSFALNVMYGHNSKATDPTNCTWDASALLYSALGAKWNKIDIWDEVHGSIKVDNHGRVSFKNNPEAKDIKLLPKSETHSILNNIFVELAQAKIN